MKSKVILTILILASVAVPASAEYLEIEASKIVSIEPTDKSAPSRLLIAWTLPEGLKDKIIDAAVISMPVSLSSGDIAPVEVAPLIRSWNPTETSWTTDWTTAGGDFDADASTSAIVTARNKYTIRADVYLTVLDQLEGKKANFGFIVIPSTDSEADLATVGANDQAALSKAKLVIAYRDRR